MGTLQILLALFIPIGVIIVMFYSKKNHQKGAYIKPNEPTTRTKEDVKPEIKDLVFATDSEREMYLLEIAKIHDTNIIAWFESDLKHLNGLFGDNWYHSSIKVYLYTAIVASEINPNIPLVLWGRHPLASVEEKSLTSLPAVSILIGMTSLDDALIQHFGGDRLKSLMEKLGHKEGEILEHSMISASIQKAQEELDRNVSDPIDAASAAEWFALNNPALH